jgi:hypothetical protein
MTTREGKPAAGKQDVGARRAADEQAVGKQRAKRLESSMLAAGEQQASGICSANPAIARHR